IRAALFWCRHALLLKKIFDLLHGKTEVARAVGQRGPIGRVDAGCASKRLDTQARIVREGRQSRRPGSCERFRVGVFLESGAGFLRLRQTKGGDRLDLVAERREQTVEFLQLAAIMAGKNQLLVSYFSHQNFQMRGSANSSELP